jgi:hypothetical protein
VVAEKQAEIGTSWYARVVCLGEYRGQPVMTFTSSQPPKPSPPGEAYLKVILGGFLEAEPTLLGQHVDRLLRAEGVAPQWSRETLVGLVNRAT